MSTRQNSALFLNTEGKPSTHRCTGWNELSIVINALRDHAQGGQGILQLAGLDEIQAHCINRLYEELVEEPSNILYSTPTGPSTTRYDSMEPSFWIECLDLLENEILKSTSN